MYEVWEGSPGVIFALGTQSELPVVASLEHYSFVTGLWPLIWQINGASGSIRVGDRPMAEFPAWLCQLYEALLPVRNKLGRPRQPRLHRRNTTWMLLEV